MTNFVPSITVDQVIDAVGNFIALFTTAQIIRGNVNRTAMPIAPFVELTEISNTALNKAIEYYSDTTATINEHKRIEIQADFYGWDLSDTIQAVHTAYRTIWGVTKFPSNIVPLYCTEPMKMPIENAEEQYEQRWTMTMSLQYNPDVTVPQDTFNTKGTTGVIPADVIYLA